MAVIYFTNNADAGTGSLRATIASAQPGDVVRPDETVFERGSTIEIALASRLDVRKTLTIDGSACRIRLNGGSSVVCLYVREGDATIINVDVVAGRSASTSSFYPGGVRVDASATFKRCRIVGCESQTTGGAMFIASGGVANLVDCLVVGNRTAAGYGGLAVGGVANVAGSTLVGNLAATGPNDVGGAGTVDLTNAIVGINAAEKTTSSGSVVGVAASQIGFVAPPSDNLASGDWTSELWKSWDLRLLDDASSAPSPYRDAGNVDTMSQYDVDGNFRGRESGGVATCSPGAYETIQADLFWIGEPFPQELVDLAPQNLVVSDFTETSEARASATVSWTTPEKANYSAISWEYKTNENPPEFTAIAPLNGKLTSRKTTIVIGRIYTIRIRGQFADGSYTAWSVVEFPADASIDDANGGGQTTGTMLPSALSVVEPSFGTSDGWAASRFARRPGDAAPQLGRTVFVDGNVHFVDVLSTTATQTFGLTIGGGSNVSVNNTSALYLGKLQLGACASFQFKNSIQIRQTGIFGDWSSTNGNFSSFQAEYVGANAYISSAYSYVFAPPEPYYGSLCIVLTRTKRDRLSGDYRCKNFYVRPDNTETTPADVAPGTTIRAQSYTFGKANYNLLIEHFFDGVPTLTPQGAAKISFITELQGDWSGEFNVDVSEADSATASLCGQTVYGVSPSVAVELSGSAKIDERGLDVASLALNADATLELKDGARLKVGSVAAAEDSSFLADFSNVEASEVNLSGAEFALTGGTVCALGTLVATSGSTFVCAASDVSIASASIADSSLDVADGILSFSGTSAFNDATAAGDGYVVVPYETDLTGLDFDETETRVCFRGANVEKFAAVSNGRETTFRWSAENPDVPVVVEVRNGDDWDVVELHARGPAFSVASGPSGEAEFRAFDGDKFLTTSIYVPAFHAWLTYDNLFTSAIVVKSYKVVTEFILMSIYFNANEAPVFLARIEDSATSTPVAPEQVESIGLTAYALRLSRGVKKRVPLDGWVDVEVPTTAIQSELIASDPRWKQDSIGYNFLFEPDLRGKQLFAQAGEYVVVISVKFKDGNPAPLVFEVAVK